MTASQLLQIFELKLFVVHLINHHIWPALVFQSCMSLELFDLLNANKAKHLK